LYSESKDNQLYRQMKSDNYKTIKCPANGIYKEKGSRFLARAYHVENQEEIKPIIDGIRKEYHDARHHSYAYMIGKERLNWRTNDDGEPSGTAGRPILGQINSSELTNILIVVSRYFGGTLLGVSGLINAYRTAAAEAIKNSEIIECTLHEYYEVKFPYMAIKDVMKILKEEDLGRSDQSFELECSIVLNFRVSAREKMLNRLSRIEGLEYRYLETR
jgi:uncharacterized YigZ family protein